MSFLSNFYGIFERLMSISKPNKVLACYQILVFACAWTNRESKKFEPSYEIMALFVLRKLILQTRMRSHPVGLDD